MKFEKIQLSQGEQKDIDEMGELELCDKLKSEQLSDSFDLFDDISEEYVFDNGKQLKDIRLSVDKVVDGLGYPMDESIKEDVVAFKVAGFFTVASCEGHLRRGRKTPWVAIAVPNEPEERFVGQNDAYEKIARKYDMSIEEIMQSDDDKYEIEAGDIYLENGQTQEYEQWLEKMDLVQKELESLLDEFYVDSDVQDKLYVERLVSVIFVTFGDNVEDSIDYGSLDEGAKRNIEQRITNRRWEMRRFSHFLLAKEMNKNQEKI
jgi:hypothetical protein